MNIYQLNGNGVNIIEIRTIEPLEHDELIEILSYVVRCKGKGWKIAF